MALSITKLLPVGPSQIKSSEVDIKFCACNFLRYNRGVDFVLVQRSFSGFSIVNLELLLYCGVYEGCRVSERRQQLVIDGLQVISEVCEVCGVQTLVAVL